MSAALGSGSTSRPLLEDVGFVYNDAFLAERQRIYDEDLKLKNASNLYEGLKGFIVEASVLHLLYKRPHLGRQPEIDSGGKPIPLEPPSTVYVVVYDRPGSLSGNILRLHANIPWSLISRYVSGDHPHVMIRDDDIYPIAKPLREFVGDDSPRKDTEDLVARLPLVAFDERIHFAKRSKFRSEIPNLLRANGLPHIVKLLGRTVDGRLVFPRLRPAPQLVSRTIGIAAVKRILLQLADAVLGLHAVGIIHRDLALRNILGSADFQTVYLCDLEGCWGSAECPEIAGASPASAAPYSEKSDVYMFGRLVTDFILRNSPWTRWQCLPGGNWLPPAPFRAIVLACLEVEPHARPDMHQVKAMLQAIPAPG